MRYDADVIVIGAGPAGSRTAGQLAAAGHDVLIIDRRPALGEPVCCTGIISRQCIEEFDIDPGLIRRRFYGARIHFPGGRFINIERPGMQAAAVDRAVLDQRMAEKAVAAGVRLQLGMKAFCVQVDGSVAAIEITQGGIFTRLYARAVVIASGFSPKLVQGLGLGKITDYALGFQCDAATPVATGVEVFLGRKIAPGFFGWLAPVSDDSAKVGLITRRRAGADLMQLVRLLQSQGKIGAALTPVRCRAIPLTTLKRTYSERLLVVGDAAGQVKSTTGGGLYYGLLCADLAAATLHKSLVINDLSAAALKEYDRNWRAVLGRDLFLGRLARGVFQRLSDRQIDYLVLRASQSGLFDRLEANEDLSFDWHGPAMLKAAGRLLPALFNL